jgi:hypothetical protein
MGRAVLAGFLALGACTLGAPPSGPSDAPLGGDGMGSNHPDAGAIRWPDAANGQSNNLPCKNTVSPAPTLGRHNPGKCCFDSCHNHGFTLAGTLYTNATGNTGFAGATISIVDAQNKALDIVVNSNGNFYTSTPLSFPVLVLASACPSAVKMEGSTPNGQCNAAGCHVGGTALQMHLP